MEEDPIPVSGSLTEKLSAAGFWVLVYIIIKLSYCFYREVLVYFLVKIEDQAVLLKSQGKWAVITGATDGIGKAYAEELAKLGLDLILISRTQAKLDAVATAIRQASKVEVKTLEIDFNGGPEISQKLKAELASTEIGILVNNVGVTTDNPDFFMNQQEEVDRRTINVNTNSCTFLTRIVLAGMIERRKGIIINISSAAAIIPTPYMAVYSGTKAYVDFFSRALQAEVKNKGIIIQCVKPYFVATKMAKVDTPSFMAPGPSEYVKQALLTVGRQQISYGCFSHAIQAFVATRLPESVHIFVAKTAMELKRKRDLKLN